MVRETLSPGLQAEVTLATEGFKSRLSSVETSDEWRSSGVGIGTGAV